MMHIPVAKLQNLFIVFAEDGFEDVWGTQVTEQSVKECLLLNKMESRSWQTAFTDDDYDHAARIAYLCKNQDFTPIEIDVGIPSIGYHNQILSDGNHRFAASIIRGDKTILASVAGETSFAKHLFVKASAKYANI